jgi:hypothetical protein
MIFNHIQSDHDFYIAYASHDGFSVRVGQQKKKDGVVLHKRFLCSKWRIPCRESKEHKWIHQKEEMWQKNQVVGNTITPQNFRWIQFVLSACQKKNQQFHLLISWLRNPSRRGSNRLSFTWYRSPSPL